MPATGEAGGVAEGGAPAGRMPALTVMAEGSGGGGGTKGAGPG